jgi:NADPH-dependent curcumin reductase CurA
LCPEAGRGRIGAVRGLEVRLAARPHGAPREEDFEVAEVEVGDPGDGEVLIRNAFLSVDPYMRPRMNGVRSYTPPFALGEAIPGGAVGQVIASRNGRWPEGTWVQHMLGWRELARSDGRGLLAIDPDAAPVSTALGVLGMPGFTAWFGLHHVGLPQAGETILVSAAAGAVGSVAGQLARLAGLTTIGSAGGPEKVGWLRELGFDRAFDYREADLRRGRPAARGCARRAPGPRQGDRLRDGLALQRGAALARPAEHRPRGDEAAADRGLHHPRPLRPLPALVRDGRLRYRETVFEGVENAPRAFIGMLAGENVGKTLVRVR